MRFSSEKAFMEPGNEIRLAYVTHRMLIVVHSWYVVRPCNVVEVIFICP